MSKMKFADTLKHCIISGRPLPLKGYTKITLTNVKTGATEVHEDCNIVTNAISNFFANNYSMTLDIFKVTPVYKWFNGVFLFTSPIEALATSIGVPCDSDNALIANAGDEPHFTPSKTRGNPNGGDTVIGADYAKFAWDWSTNQGNGDIACCCLTSGVAGNAGTKPVDDTYFGVNCDITNKTFMRIDTSWTRDASIACPQAWKNDNEAYSFWVTEGRFEEITVKHDFLKVSLTSAITDFTATSSRVATIRTTFGTKPYQILVEDDYYYIVQVYDSHTLSVDRISRADMSVTPMDITVSGATFETFETGYGLTSYPTFDVPKERGYLYHPKVNNSTFYRISLSNLSDVVELTNNITDAPLANNYASWNASTSTPTTCSSLGSVQCGHHFIVGFNYIINGDQIYPCRGISRGDTTSQNTTAYSPSKFFFGKAPNSLYQSGFHAVSGNARPSYSGVCIPNYYLATVNNLSSVITKEANQTMKVEYTITQA